MRYIGLTLVAIVALVFVGLSIAHTGAHLVALQVLSDHHAPLVVMFGMAALGTGNLTLADWAKRLDPNGKAATIAELLNQKNEILDDMQFQEGNLPTGHRLTVRTGLPAVAWRLLNQGVIPSKSTTAQIDEQIGMLEAWSEVDKDLATLNGNVESFRLGEARAFIEAMSQEAARVLFYGNAGLNPEQFTGLSVRYGASTGANTDNVIKAGGAGATNASIWLVCWGPDTIFGVFPKGSKAGLIHEDYGEVTAEVVAGLPGARMRALQERFQWKLGIALKDWRYVVRICNIDVPSLNAANVKTIINNMETAVETVPDNLGTPVFYMNRTMRRFLRREARESVGSGGGLTYENFAGKRVLMFGDVPIKRADALLNTEATVV